jgi:3'(2'), 5'-bisphosphate nucleotidase
MANQNINHSGVDIRTICQIAQEAGQKILEIYGQDNFQIESKEDNSPLTIADKVSHNLIKKRLSALYPKIPILSEEGRDISFDERRAWNRFWLVDPLDGTKEFIKRNGEFTVNIALIQNNHPVLGVIYAPVLQTLYWGAAGKGALKQNDGQETEFISVSTSLNDSIIGVGSRSHASEEEVIYAKRVGSDEKKSIGSSLKFCLVAEGSAHYYYRHGPTMEWDTAAGQAIVEAAGGIVTGLSYNKKNLLNGSFLVRSTEQLDEIKLGS